MIDDDGVALHSIAHPQPPLLKRLWLRLWYRFFMPPLSSDSLEEMEIELTMKPSKLDFDKALKELEIIDKTIDRIMAERDHYKTALEEIRNEASSYHSFKVAEKTLANEA